MNERQSIRSLVCGMQGTGKTRVAIDFINALKNNPYEKNVLVLSPDPDELSLSFLPEISADQLRYTRPIFHRLTFDESDEKFYIKIRDGFSNGLLVVDDGTFFLANSRNETFNKMIMRARQKNIDIIYVCHGMGTIPPSFWAYFNHLILFYTSDNLNNPTARKNIPDIEDKIKWQKEVNRTAQQTGNAYYKKAFKLQPTVNDFIKTHTHGKEI